ncbi:hypothetical protein [Gilliamella sp. ESL0250]|uniref:hypothetical protein n=1 Tax=Gilliamella sp. ESL0250 TaxID=2705036 RepID=UPI001580E81C|nr:hypothetical protein [Gilliamella sp. ESL0250]NUF50546.1 hypothetical protein [Gilliamella sp. ESL0250]
MGGTFQEQEVWCSGFGYRLTQLEDLTNAVCTERGDGKDYDDCSHCRGRMVGGMPSSPNNLIQFRIGGGLLTEWVYPRHYNAQAFPASWLWTK